MQVKVPKIQDQLRFRQISNAQINQLEEVWRDNPEATSLDTIHQIEEAEEVQDCCLRYSDGYSYQNILAPLVNLEAEENRRVTEGQKQEDVTVQWDRSLSGKKLATFYIPASMHVGGDLKVAPGDELNLKLDTTSARLNGNVPWEGKGIVTKVDEVRAIYTRLNTRVKTNHVLE